MVRALEAFERQLGRLLALGDVAFVEVPRWDLLLDALQLLSVDVTYGEALRVAVEQRYMIPTIGAAEGVAEADKKGEERALRRLLSLATLAANGDTGGSIAEVRRVTAGDTDTLADNQNFTTWIFRVEMKGVRPAAHTHAAPGVSLHTLNALGVVPEMRKPVDMRQGGGVDCVGLLVI